MFIIGGSWSVVGVRSIASEDLMLAGLMWYHFGLDPEPITARFEPGKINNYFDTLSTVFRIDWIPLGDRNHPEFVSIYG